MTSYAASPTLPLRVYRVARNLSQRELGVMADIRQESISRIECGHHAPSRKTAAALSDALGVPPEVLFPPEPPTDNEITIPTAGEES